MNMRSLFTFAIGSIAVGSAAPAVARESPERPDGLRYSLVVHLDPGTKIDVQRTIAAEKVARCILSRPESSVWVDNDMVSAFSYDGVRAVNYNEASRDVKSNPDLVDQLIVTVPHGDGSATITDRGLDGRPNFVDFFNSDGERRDTISLDSKRSSVRTIRYWRAKYDARVKATLKTCPKNKKNRRYVK